MVFAINLYEDFIDVEGVTVASVFSLQSSGVESSEFNAPEPDRFSGYGDTPFGQEIFDIAVTQVEAIVEPNCVADDIWRESVAFICIQALILTISGS